MASPNKYFSNYEGIYTNLHEPALIIAGCSVLVALVLSIVLILQHLRSYTKPEVSKFFIISCLSFICYELLASFMVHGHWNCIQCFELYQLTFSKLWMERKINNTCCAECFFRNRSGLLLLFLWSQSMLLSL